MKNGRLVLGIENAIHQEKLQADDNRQIIETVLAEMFGVSFTVVVTVSSPSGERDQAQDELLAQDDVLAFGVNELGGELSPLDGE